MQIFCKNNIQVLAITVVALFAQSCTVFRGGNTRAKKVINIARSYTGTVYKLGGNNSDGLDCSGLICTTYTQIGIKLPRISWQQAEQGKVVDFQKVQPADLVFFITNKGNIINHSGIVTRISGNEIWFIHASSSKGVIEDNLMTDYWQKKITKAVRIL